MARVESINDIIPPTHRIRRDQHKKIKGIVDTNAKFPQVAIGLVRDLVKNSSMRDIVTAVGFSDRAYNPVDRYDPAPHHITLYTRGFDYPSIENLGTAYHFTLKPETKHIAPTL